MEEKPILDWKSVHDPRSKDFRFYNMTAPGSLGPLKPKFWRPGVILNQGKEGACVGFGWTAELVAAPFSYEEQIAGEATKFAQFVYHKAREHDRALGYVWPEGASVLGGAKAVMTRGFIKGYRWALNINEVRDAVRSEGPVVVGVPWMTGMYQTRKSGLVEISGQVVGGHCLTLTGYHPGMRIAGEDWNERYEVFRWVNSWGPEYGINGTGLIRLKDLEYLLKKQGEACIPMHRHPIEKLK